MKNYKVIKGFGAAEKGDILTWDDEDELYKIEVDEEGSYRFLAIDASSAENFVKDGYLIELIDEPRDCGCCKECVCGKLAEIKDFVDGKLEEYEDNYNSMMEKYTNQEIPTCVKVEAETVYYNLSKLLTQIKEMLA